MNHWVVERGLVILLAVGAVSCGGKKAQLKIQAANDLACTPEQITPSSIASYVEKVNGCGRENVYAYDGGQGRWVSPLDRAAFDLSCPKGELTTQHLGTRDVGVSGCGKKAVYVLNMMSGWVMNTTGDAPASKDPASP